MDVALDWTFVWTLRGRCGVRNVDAVWTFVWRLVWTLRGRWRGRPCGVLRRVAAPWTFESRSGRSRGRCVGVDVPLDVRVGVAVYGGAVWTFVWTSVWTFGRQPVWCDVARWRDVAWTSGRTPVVWCGALARRGRWSCGVGDRLDVAWTFRFAFVRTLRGRYGVRGRCADARVDVARALRWTSNWALTWTSRWRRVGVGVGVRVDVARAPRCAFALALRRARGRALHGSGADGPAGTRVALRRRSPARPR